jgi:sugar lactone lactonase YvrE
LTAYLISVSVTSSALVPQVTASEAVGDLTIDRKEVYEFTKTPTITREGDRVTIRFASKDHCDVAVVIEDADGRIVRHLAYGVLGANAPAPFKKDSLEQEIVWDGKDDAGLPVEKTSGLSFRVSLGLKARLERTLFWRPKKRLGVTFNPLMFVQPEGVYVYDGGAVETIRLFGHDGTYIRTVYPFPAGDIEKVKGLKWHTFADGLRTALYPEGEDKPDPSRCQQTFLFSGLHAPRGMGLGSAAAALAVHDGSLALVSPLFGPWHGGRETFQQFEKRLNRLGVGECLSAHDLYGPSTGLQFPPRSAAFSPDKKWLYLTGLYGRGNRYKGDPENKEDWRHGVYRMEFDANGPAQLWLGEADRRGKDDAHFNLPASVCVDAKGQVYVADHGNDRVQIFSPEGKLLRSVPVLGPVIVQIHHRTQELYVFSWPIASSKWTNVTFRVIPPLLSVFDPLASSEPKQKAPLLLTGITSGDRLGPHQVGDDMGFRAVLDSYTAPPTLWMCTHHLAGQAHVNLIARQISLYRLEGDELVLLEKWNEEVEKAIGEFVPREGLKRRMHVDPRTGVLYVEGAQGWQGPMYFSTLNRIDPETGEVTVVPLPMSALNFAIDDEGHLYLRAANKIGRFDLDTMEEVPFANGEEVKDARALYGHVSTDLKGALVLHNNAAGSVYGGHFWQSGIGVNSRGDLLVSWDMRTKEMNSRNPIDPAHRIPGVRRTEGNVRTVFDKDGKVLLADAIPSGRRGYASLIDNRGDIYVLLKGRRAYEDGSATLPGSGCVLKYRPGREMTDAATSDSIPSPEGVPILGRRRDEVLYLKGAEWVYPFAGYSPQGCACWAMCFAIDHFGRSFVPAHSRRQVAILDTSGNLIAHVGRYGNVDDGRPLAPDPEGLRAEPPRSIGGDEVAMAYGCYVGTHSDRRLFIFDGNNDCIRSVKLDYHVSQRVPLDKGQSRRQP